MNIKVVFSVLLLLSLMNIYGQEIYHGGYIVTDSGDTLKGLVKITGKKTNPGGCFFKPSADVAPIAFVKRSLKTISQTDFRYYTLVIIGKDTVFAQKLITGKINLLSWDEKFYLETDGQFQELKEERVQLANDKILDKKVYIGTLRVAMNDCLQLSKAIDASRLTESSLTDLFEKYHQCINQRSFSHKSNIPSMKVAFRVLAGVNLTKMNISVAKNFRGLYGYLQDLNWTRISPTGGIGIRFSTPKFTENFSLDLEARYTSMSANEIVITPESTWDYNEVNFRYSAVVMPFTFAYIIDANPRLAFQVRAGILKTVKLDGEFKSIQRQTQYPDVSARESERFTFYGSPTGYCLAAGMRWKTTKNVLHIDASYDNVGPIVNSTTVGFIMNIYAVTAGITF